MTTLRKGSKGSEVITLQSALNRAGYSLNIDGDFGSATLAAVVDFQKRHGLTRDGVVGGATWSALEPYLISDADFRKAFKKTLADLEKLPSFKTLLEMM